MTRLILSLTFLLCNLVCNSQTNVEFHLANAHGEFLTSTGVKFEVIRYDDKSAQELYNSIVQNINAHYTDSATFDLKAIPNSRVVLKTILNPKDFKKKEPEKIIWVSYEFLIKDNELKAYSPKFYASKYSAVSWHYKNQVGLWLKDEKSQKKYNNEICTFEKNTNKRMNNLLIVLQSLATEQLGSNSFKFNLTHLSIYERHSISRWFGHSTLPDYKRSEQTDAPNLRQTNDLLPNIGVDVGWHS